MRVGFRLRRLAVSAFVLFHAGATVLWVLPACPLQAACAPVIRCYMLPLGLWQYWGMFAPDPVLQTLILEADAVDARGLRHTFAFPKTGGLPLGQAVLASRHPKLAANQSVPGQEFARACLTRYALRQLDLPAEAYPVEAYLVYQAVAPPPPGGPPADPLAQPHTIVLDSFRFETRSEVFP